VHIRLDNLTIVSYASSLEKLDLQIPALDLCFKYTRVPETAAVATHALSEIIVRSSTIGCYLKDLTREIRRLILSQVNIFDKIRVVKAYGILAVRDTDKLDIPNKIGLLIDAFGAIDLDSCDSSMASDVLKIGFEIGKTVYLARALEKLDAAAWKEGKGKKMREWFRDVVATFFRRFGDDFEIMEVIISLEYD
jgi:hypothetical protein